jgi:hypothetical protein
MMVVVTMVDHNDDLRLRRIRYCEAEEEHEAKQSLFHNSQYGVLHLRMLSYCDQGLHCSNKLINSA